MLDHVGRLQSLRGQAGGEEKGRQTVDLTERLLVLGMQLTCSTISSQVPLSSCFSDEVISGLPFY